MCLSQHPRVGFLPLPPPKASPLPSRLRVTWGLLCAEVPCRLPSEEGGFSWGPLQHGTWVLGVLPRAFDARGSDHHGLWTLQGLRMARAQQSVHVSEGSQWRVPCWPVSTPTHSSCGPQAYFDSRDGIGSPVREVGGSKPGISFVPFLSLISRWCCVEVYLICTSGLVLRATGWFSYDNTQACLCSSFFSRRSYWTRCSRFAALNLTFLCKDAECILARSKGRSYSLWITSYRDRLLCTC